MDRFTIALVAALLICHVASAQAPRRAAPGQEPVHVENVVTNDDAPPPGTRIGSFFALFFDDVDLGDLDDRFDDPEVAALAGRDLSGNGARLGHALTWGLMLGTDIQIGHWLRLPEIRFGFGGGSIDGPWHPVEGAIDTLEVRATDTYVLRAEIGGGVAHAFGPVTPFAMLHLGYEGWFTSVDVRDQRLGPLGSETLTDGNFEAGSELGASFDVGPARLSAAWRHALLGPSSDGLLLSVSFHVPADQG